MNKLIFFLGIAVLLNSCYNPISTSTLKPNDRKVTYFSFDFRPYNQKGFYFSPYPYPGKFEPIGQIFVEIIPECKIRVISQKIIRRSNNFEESIQTKEILDCENVSADYMLELLYNKAIELGADGIVSLIAFNNDEVIEASNIAHLNISNKYKIQGFAIKRSKE
jgi:hypothetical protein